MPTTPGEHKTVQARILEYAEAIGWTVEVALIWWLKYLLQLSIQVGQSNVQINTLTHSD
jgi:hypothetical protein